MRTFSSPGVSDLTFAVLGEGSEACEVLSLGVGLAVGAAVAPFLMPSSSSLGVVGAKEDMVTVRMRSTDWDGGQGAKRRSKERWCHVFRDSFGIPGSGRHIFRDSFGIPADPGKLQCVIPIS